MRIVIAFFLFLFVSPALAERASLSELSDYLNTIKSAEAGFKQVNSDGSKSSGTLKIARPGRARFEYNSPNDALVLAGGGAIAVFDGRAHGAPEQYPLKQSPLNLILARKVDLTRAKMITGIGTHRGHTIVEASDRDHPEYGKIRLYFEQEPLRLAEWLIISQSGEETRVILDPFVPQSFSGSLFNIRREAQNRK